MPTNWELCFLCHKTKRKDVMQRSPTSLENLIDGVKRFIQLDPTDFDLSRIDEGTGIIQKLASHNSFYRKGCDDNNVASMIVIMKDCSREYRTKVQKILLTGHKLFPTNEKKMK